MKFSVLIAHYNNAEYFKDLHRSLLSQTWNNWEAVILDDGSHSEEKEAVEKLIAGDERFRFYENDENYGVGITKAKLIELASGQICGFVDPDDAILPTAIEKSVEIFKNDNKTVLTYSRFVTCDENLKPVAPFRAARQVPNHDKFFFNYPIQIAHFVNFRKEVYESTEKMNPELKIAEDQDLYLKMYEKGKVKFINEANYLYRKHEGGISQNDNKKKSYEFWGKVIYDAMKRRNIHIINGKKVPEKFTTEEEIFTLLDYQNGIKFRILKKLKSLFQNW